MPVLDLLINWVLILAFGGLGYWLGRTRPRAWVGIGLSIALGGLGVLMILRPDLFARVFPFADLIFYSNLFPFGAAVFIPCVFAFAKSRAQRIRMGILCAVLFGVSLKEYAYHYRPLAHLYQSWINEDGVCRQTSGDTCSAAALVTLLRKFGIESSEQEAIELARTKERTGTIHLGLYRALKIKTRGRADLTVRLRKLPVEDLLGRGRPAVITVGLPRNPTHEALVFGEKYNWQPGFLHDVAFLGPDPKRPGCFLIGEPDFGLESWRAEHLRFLYYGFAVTLD